MACLPWSELIKSGEILGWVSVIIINRMMMSWDGNTFCITVPLCRESSNHWWIPLTKDQWCGAFMFSLSLAWTGCCTNSWQIWCCSCSVTVIGIYNYTCLVLYWVINSLWPSDAIWRQKSWSTLAQVMACCLMAPSHYLNQCWLIISKV